MFILFLKGLLIGFAIAAPVGPIGALCISRTVSHGFSAGLVSGLGAACADGVYGVIAGLGLTVISTFLIHEQYWIHLMGGLFLIYLGIKLFFSQTHDEMKVEKKLKLFSMFLSTFLLTLTNPATILSFLAIFSSVNLQLNESGIHYFAPLLLISGVLLGSALWWLILSSSVSFVKHKLSLPALKRINQLSGLFIFAFGIFAILSR